MSLSLLETLNFKDIQYVEVQVIVKSIVEPYSWLATWKQSKCLTGLAGSSKEESSNELDQISSKYFLDY